MGYSKNPRPSCHRCDQRVPSPLRPSVCQSGTFRSEERYRISLMQPVGVPLPLRLPRLRWFPYHMQQLRRHFRHSRDGDDDDNGDAGEGGKAKARVGEKEKREAAAAERPLENTMGLLPSHPPARSLRARGRGRGARHGMAAHSSTGWPHSLSPLIVSAVQPQ